jgi:23S rRNA (guanine745-N1)-methyltransferase
VRLLCTVRGCREPLERDERRLVCPRGHSYDVARSGYVNLLQPQDRRSAHPGDRRDAAEARRRLYDAGHGAPLVAELLRQLDACPALARPRVLDLGCGEGSLLAALGAARALASCGIDLSRPAIELAARRSPAVTWVIANVDRFVPVASGEADVALLVSAHADPRELHRVLASEGRLIVVTPATDDLGELRAAVLGEATVRTRMERALVELAPAFEVEARTAVRHRVVLDAALARDALAATYRGARRSQQERLAALAGGAVTMSFDVARLRPRTYSPRKVLAGATESARRTGT